jgi:hypothetical protein
LPAGEAGRLREPLGVVELRSDSTGNQNAARSDDGKKRSEKRLLLDSDLLA